MDLTATLAATLTTILEPKNIFRFVELILKNKVVLTKYHLTRLLNCGCLSQFGVKWVVNILLITSPIGTIYRECTLFYYMLEF